MPGRIGWNSGLSLFEDNNYILRSRDSIGNRLAKVATDNGILNMMCYQCALERSLANGKSGFCQSPSTVASTQVGCFPNLYTTPSGNLPDWMITL